jgi:hypothetical protein
VGRGLGAEEGEEGRWDCALIPLLSEVSRLIWVSVNSDGLSAFEKWLLHSWRAYRLTVIAFWR